MSDKTIPTIWWAWLLTMCTITALFSLGFVLLPEAMMAATSETYLGAADAHEAYGEEGVAYLRFALGTTGAIAVAWMAALALVALGPFRRGEPWAWNLITVSILVWFVIDGANSVMSGFPENALYNVAFLIGFGIPLATTYTRFRAQ